MIMDAAKLSALIREKKKKMRENPEVVSNSPEPEMNALDAENAKQYGRIEETLNSPHKINAEDTEMDETYHGVGIPPADMGRMSRLRKYFDAMGF
jgi:hypothetical protein